NVVSRAHVGAKPGENRHISMDVLFGATSKTAPYSAGEDFARMASGKSKENMNCIVQESAMGLAAVHT
ncbi:MAG: hypothetical protein WBP80_10695, partial [Planifilum fulgidum]